MIKIIIAVVLIVALISIINLILRKKKEGNNIQSQNNNIVNQTKTCPFCSEEILIDAKKCKHCGEFLDPKLAKQRKQNNFRFSIHSISSAVLLISFFIPWISVSFLSLNVISGYEIPKALNTFEQISSLFSQNVAKNYDFSYLYLIPLLAFISFICSFFKHLSYITALITGTASLFIIAGLIVIFMSDATSPEVGIWLTIISTLFLILFSLADIAEIISDAYLKTYKSTQKISKTKEYFLRGFITIFIFMCYIFILIKLP